MNNKSKIQHPDTHFKVMDLIHKYPDISQREIAKQASISLGSVHYCLRALGEKGWLKVKKFKNNPNKSAYFYLLTPEGVFQKSRLAVLFLRRKKQEYDQMKLQIDALSKELYEKN